VSTRNSILPKEGQEENKENPPQTYQENNQALNDPSNDDDVKLSSNIDG
jgi:hypothetical protein